jgi:intracellular multiplication protein IcmV
VIKKTMRGVGRFIKPLVNFPVWIGWKNLKENNQRLGALMKVLFAPSKINITPETFAEAVARLGLTEADISARQQYFKRLAILYALIAVALLVYAFYLLFVEETALGFAMSLAVVWMALALGFKQHFWYTQMRVRRLGLSFKDWLTLAFRT